MRRSTKFFPRLLLLTSVIAAQTALSQGRGEGGLVVRDGAVIYVSSKGPRVEVKNLPRGFPVVGVMTLGMSTTFQFEEEDGRLHIWYLTINDKGQYKSLQRSAWMDPADIERFTYECGCEAGAEAGRKCSPLASSGFVDRSWNACFMEAYSKKLAELKGRTQSPSSLQNSVVAAPARATAQLTIDQVIQLITAKLPDDVIITTIQNSHSRFDLTPEALIKLKTAGASDEVIRATRNVGLAPAEGGASPSSPAPVGEAQQRPPNQASRLERVVPFRTGELIALDIVEGPVKITSVEVTTWPKPEKLQRAEGRPTATTSLTFRFTYANPDDRKWTCQYRIALLDDKGEEIGSGEREADLDKRQKADTNDVDVKMRTLDFPKAAKLRVVILARRH